MPHNFWMINCNRRNFDVTRRLGFTSQGLKAEYRRKVQRVEPGDRIIYYVTGIRAFAATATVTASYTEMNAGPWLKEGRTGWPYRIGIKPDVVLDEAQYIPAGLLAYRLEYIRKWPPEDWPIAFQGNLHLLSKGDFFMLECEMLKLRDGREKALVEIERQLAAENEKQNAQRERRRRSANRPAQPKAGGPGPASEKEPAPESDTERRTPASTQRRGSAADAPFLPPPSERTAAGAARSKRGDVPRRNARSRRRRPGANPTPPSD